MAAQHWPLRSPFGAGSLRRAPGTTGVRLTSSTNIRFRFKRRPVSVRPPARVSLSCPAPFGVHAPSGQSLTPVHGRRISCVLPAATRLSRCQFDAHDGLKLLLLPHVRPTRSRGCSPTLRLRPHHHAFQSDAVRGRLKTVPRFRSRGRPPTLRLRPSQHAFQCVAVRGRLKQLRCFHVHDRTQNK